MAKSTLKRRADGRYRKIITNAQGKKIYFYGKTERELFDKIIEYQGRAAKGRTFKEVADVWLQEKWEEISPTTVRAYRAGYASVTDISRTNRSKRLPAATLWAISDIWRRRNTRKKPSRISNRSLTAYSTWRSETVTS